MAHREKWKIFIFATAILGFATLSMAGNYGAAGCGLGSIVHGDKSGGVQIFAATTNGTSGNQTFGITSGTSNCVPSNKEEAALFQQQFITNNFNTLAKEMAQGEGEALHAFVSLLGCGNKRYAEVSHHLQENHGSYFQSPGALGVLNAIKTDLSAKSPLSSSCMWLI